MKAGEQPETSEPEWMVTGRPSSAAVAMTASGAGPSRRYPWAAAMSFIERAPASTQRRSSSTASGPRVGLIRQPGRRRSSPSRAVSSSALIDRGSGGRPPGKTTEKSIPASSMVRRIPSRP